MLVTDASEPKLVDKTFVERLVPDASGLFEPIKSADKHPYVVRLVIRVLKTWRLAHVHTLVLGQLSTLR